MNVHQLSATYLAEQDRILVRINTTDAEELRLWFTRRLLLGLRPLLDRLMAEQLVLFESSVTSGAATDDMKKMLADFRKAELLQQADFGTPYKEQQAALPLGEAPLLVTEVNVTPQSDRRLAMEFLEKLPGDAAVRSFRLELEPQLTQGFLHLLDQALQHAHWQTADTVAVPAEAADDPAGTKPRYLN